jgi:endoglucanase
MRLPVAAVAACLVLGLAACGGDDREAASPVPPAVAPTATSTPSAPEGPTREEELAELQRQAEMAAQAARKARRKATRQRVREERRRVERQERREAINADNPLKGREWGVYTGPQEMLWEPYERSGGETRETLAEIALRPKAKWMGAWIPDGEIYAKTREYIEVSQAGDPEKLVQMAMFRSEPWYHQACDRLPSPAEQASYRAWTDEFARAIGDTPTAVILQPDGPFALCVPGGSPIPSQLIAYSAEVLGALPRTSVYIDAGAADWPSAGQGGAPAAVDFLVPAGIEHARGVALNSTHYSATELEVVRGAELSEELARRGYPGKKVVINTSSNGQPFEFGRYTGPDPDDAYPCRSKDDDRTCVALGIPPTADVAAERWGLPDDVRDLARRYVDGYLWFGRPWLYRQNQPFVMDRALPIIRSSPYVD